MPGLTKMVSQLTKDGQWQKALEIFEGLEAIGVRADTTITNAAISACDKGGQWQKALDIWRSMEGQVGGGRTGVRRRAQGAGV